MTGGAIMRGVRIGLCFALLVLVAIGFTGCLKASVSSFLRYDPSDDSFHALQTFDDIVASSETDRTHLKRLIEQRDALIINPLQLHLFDESAFIRKGPHEYCKISLAQPGQDETEVRKTSIDLGQIQIEPGQFHLTKEGHLSYYQQIKVPGKTIDALLEPAGQMLAAGLAEGAQGMLQNLDDGKHEQLTWQQVRQQLMAQLRGEEQASASEQVAPFTRETLKAWTQLAKGAIKITRNRDNFTATLPMAPGDAKEVLAILQEGREAIEKGTSETIKDLEKAKLVLSAFEARPSGSGIEISIRFSEVAKLFQADQSEPAQPAPATQTAATVPFEKPPSDADYKATINLVASSGIRVDRAALSDAARAPYLEKK
jgi:hypothetical protein